MGNNKEILNRKGEINLSCRRGWARIERRLTPEDRRLIQEMLGILENRGLIDRRRPVLTGKRGCGRINNAQ